MKFSISEISRLCAGKLVGNYSNEIVKAATDTRTLEAGSIFFALRAKTDGHQYVPQAFSKGAAAAVVDEEGYRSGFNFDASGQNEKCFVVVKDVYEALGKLAHAQRQQFNIPIIDVTGSAGKTTTKECIRSILSFRWQTRMNQGNFNNHIGLPLSLLELNQNDEAGVFELGASQPGDIDYLARMSSPTIGVVTCIEPAHLETFGSMEKIYETKLELAQHLKQSGGVLFVQGDDPELAARAKSIGVQMVQFGRSGHCDFILTDEKQAGDQIHFTVNERFKFALKGFGIFNSMNALAALSVGDYLGFDLEEMSRQWKEMPVVANRFQLEQWDHPKIQVIKDCYNANPHAFALALKSFEALPVQGKKIVVSGDMLELGPQSENFHRQLGIQIADSGAGALAAVGRFASVVCGAAKERNQDIDAAACPDNSAAAHFLISILKDGDALFLKGSRGMKLEEIVPLLRSGLMTTGVT